MIATLTPLLGHPCSSNNHLGSPAGSIGVRVAASGIEASDIIQMAGGYGPLAGGQKPASAHDGTVQERYSIAKLYFTRSTQGTHCN